MDVTREASSKSSLYLNQEIYNQKYRFSEAHFSFSMQQTFIPDAMATER